MKSLDSGIYLKDGTSYQGSATTDEINASEFVKAQKMWWEDKMPHDVVYRSAYAKNGSKNASFLVVSNIYNAEAIGKTISRAKKIVKECEKENGYYLYSERLTFKLVADRDDIHLVMWFSEY